MIEYIFPHNPDDRILKKASSLLKAGELVVIPTDTSWVLLADPFHKGAVEKLYRAKNEEKSHHFSLLCEDISSASELAHISDKAFRLIRGKVPGHYTFIFDATKKMIKSLKASKTDHQVGLRFVPQPYITELLKVHTSPLLSTNIDSHLLGRPLEEGEVYSYELEEALKSTASLIIDPGELDFVGASTIIDLRDGHEDLIRLGAGEPLF
ncbi:MAG: L-threonylcarbamoyladenylate synthase [Bdellovibrionota bacterium]|nr:L-threonylcarbamoyladenylate synthase [Bdellovibrionota bacterium]